MKSWNFVAKSWNYVKIVEIAEREMSIFEGLDGFSINRSHQNENFWNIFNWRKCINSLASTFQLNKLGLTEPSLAGKTGASNQSYYYLVCPTSVCFGSASKCKGWNPCTLTNQLLTGTRPGTCGVPNHWGSGGPRERVLRHQLHILNFPNLSLTLIQRY